MADRLFKMAAPIIGSNITEVSDRPKCQISALNVIAIRVQRHANASKQTTLLAGVDVDPPKGAAQRT